MADIAIPTLRGGLNDSDPPHIIPDDQCTVADNVEFFYSTLGERRRGCTALDITGSGLVDEAAIGFISQWFPDNDIGHPEIWALGATSGVSTTLTKRSAFGTWSEVTPTDAIDTGSPQVWGMNAQVLNSKQFFAYQSPVDRLHLWDGDTMRRAGLAQPPAAPTAANEGSGSYADTRYFRIRYIKRTASGTILVRSEPSDEVTFEPSGTGAGVTITRPDLIGESETDWEVEASEDDENWYRIATVTGLTTTTYNDETDLAVESYADVGTLSEDVGSYQLLPSAKYLTIDGDRLIFGGHWTDDAKKSLVGWTPVENDPGVGDDERLPLEFDNTVTLDTTDKGEITGLSDSTNGTWYAFKWSNIYKFTRLYSGALRAYQVFNLSKSHGAIPGSIVSGADENGRSCIYFLDPSIGPMRLGAAGLQQILGLRSTWARVNATATIAARACYYSDKNQIHWWVAVDGNDTPNLEIVLQTDEIRSDAGGASRGFSLATGRRSQAYAAAAIHDLSLNEEGNQVVISRPFIGLTTPNCIQRCDIGDTDDGYTYVARIRTKAFFSAGLLNAWGAMSGALLADTNASATIKVSFIRDFGRFALDTMSVTTTLAPEGAELYVIKVFDQLDMSEAKGIQVEFGDV